MTTTGTLTITDSLRWGAYKGHLQHLFPARYCCMSVCGYAYAGDRGLSCQSNRRKCKRCERIAERQQEEQA
jgi:hypothetical protein